MARSQVDQHEAAAALKRAISDQFKFLFPNCSVQVSEAQLTAEELQPFAVKVRITLTAQIMPKTTEEKPPEG
jgi:hypothetical protein